MSRVPAYLYHADHDPTVFETEEALNAALESGWVDTPAALSQPELADESAPKRVANMNRDELTAFVKDTWGETLPRNVKLDELKVQVVARLEA